MELHKKWLEHSTFNDGNGRQEEEEEKVPVMYTCIHKNDPLHCKFWDQHTHDPCYYPKVDAHTPCRFCGHRGTLRVSH